MNELKKIPCVNIKPSELCDYTAVNYELLRKKELEYNELIKTLIKRVSFECSECEFNLCSAVGCLAYEEMQVIEKTTGETWEEVKELI